MSIYYTNAHTHKYIQWNAEAEDAQKEVGAQKVFFFSVFIKICNIKGPCSEKKSLKVW